MKKTFYITTPIFYANDVPHIGTAYTVFIADTLARYHRMILGNQNVLFLTGTDEHGAKIAQSAAKAGVTPRQLVDDISSKFKDTWKSLNITNDYFIRTTNPEHKEYTQWLIQKAYDNGDLYEGTYEGLYCQGCEAYYKESDLVEGRCPNHPTKSLQHMSENNYYFRLSKYKDFLLEHISNNPDFIKPLRWRNYVESLIKDGLEDVPVTRENVAWGIPVPFAPSQTIYVWYDALPNYISYLNFSQNKKAGLQEKFWKNVVHVVGKDILKFHAILWPAMLKSVNLPLPGTILVNGFFTVDGMKIGKSNGNAIDPVELANKYSIDAVRYALLTEFQIGNDGDFNVERLEAKYNGELGNNFGNLLNRVIHLSNKKNLNICEFDKVKDIFRSRVQSFVYDYHNHMQGFAIKEAAEVVNELFSFGNKYIDEAKPWNSNDSNKDFEVLNNLSFLLYEGIKCYTPIIPEAASRALLALENKDPVILFKKIL